MDTGLSSGGVPVFICAQSLDGRSPPLHGSFSCGREESHLGEIAAHREN